MEYNHLYIAGIGMGNEALLSAEVKEILSQGKRLYVTGGVLKRADYLEKGQELSVEAVMAALEDNSADAVVAVSGDAGFFSIANGIYQKLAGKYQIHVLNGTNSLQYLCGKLCMPYDNIPVASVHGRNINVIAKVSYNKKLFLLTGGANSPEAVCRQLKDAGLGYVSVAIGENLSYETEKIATGRADEFIDCRFDPLSVMLIENNRCPDLSTPLKDEDFIRGKAPMTKFEVRQVCLGKMAVKAEDTVYDIGAGTGSLSVELARKALSGTVFAIEHQPEACRLLEENRRKHGAYNLNIVQGEASAAILSLPKPDKVFIGGSSGNLKDIVQNVLQKNPEARIVLTAVTLQTLAEVMDITGIEMADTVCLNVAKAKKMGRYDMMVAQNPVYVVTLEKPEEAYGVS